MKLHWSPRSPFVRKVMIVLHETDLLKKVELSRNVVAMQQLPPDPVLADNPLGKIPVLVTEAGQPLYDSRVICEYLDARSGSGLFPQNPDHLAAHLRLQSLCDGLTETLLLWRIELQRETGFWPEVEEGWRRKVLASMAWLEEETRQLDQMAFGIGHIALVCALGQLDFRWRDSLWREGAPRLAAWEAQIAQRPSVQATRVTDDQQDQAPDITAGRLSFAAASPH